MYDYFVQPSCSLLDTGVIGGLFRYSYILLGTEIVVWSDVVVYLGYSGDGNFGSLFYIDYCVYLWSLVLLPLLIPVLHLLLLVVCLVLLGFVRGCPLPPHL